MIGAQHLHGLAALTVVALSKPWNGPTHRPASMNAAQCAEVGRDTIALRGRIEPIQDGGPFRVVNPSFGQCIQPLHDGQQVAPEVREVAIWPASLEARDALASRAGQDVQLRVVVLGVSRSGAYRVDPVAIDGDLLPPPPTTPPPELAAMMPPMEEEVDEPTPNAADGRPADSIGMVTPATEAAEMDASSRSSDPTAAPTGDDARSTFAIVAALIAGVGGLRWLGRRKTSRPPPPRRASTGGTTRPPVAETHGDEHHENTVPTTSHGAMSGRTRPGTTSRATHELVLPYDAPSAVTKTVEVLSPIGAAHGAYDGPSRTWRVIVAVEAAPGDPTPRSLTVDLLPRPDGRTLARCHGPDGSVAGDVDPLEDAVKAIATLATNDDATAAASWRDASTRDSRAVDPTGGGLPATPPSAAEAEERIPARIRQNLKRHEEHRGCTCLDCGYSGLMGVKKHMVPWYGSYWTASLALVAAFISGWYMLVWAIPLVLMGRFAERYLLACPSCNTELVSR
jgi:hypothetical protein